MKEHPYIYLGKKITGHDKSTEKYERYNKVFYRYTPYSLKSKEKQEAQIVLSEMNQTKDSFEEMIKIGNKLRNLFQDQDFSDPE